jgi:hypothetical protein
MSSTINYTETLSMETCCSCGVVFAMPGRLKQERLNNGGGFYCPNGHGQHYTKTEVQKLKEQLEVKDRELRASKCENLAERNLRELEALARQKAEKKSRRVQKGVCPCCSRSFQNLGRHMATKHPTVKPAA